jgi:general secretion pathway protein F
VRFEIRAFKTGEGIVALTLDAADEAAARAQARMQGLTVLSARTRGIGVPGIRLTDQRFPLLLFSQELLALLGAGLSLVEVLETMAEKETRPEARKVIARLTDALYEGRALSQALAEFPGIFPTLYVATVRAAERTGDLPEALGRYVEYHQRLDAVKKKIVSAAIYPAVLIGVGLLVTLFLLGYVVPRFSQIYDSTGRNLPWLSQVLLQWGRLLNAYGGLVLLGTALALILLVVGFGRAASWALAAAWRIPALGRRMLTYQLARFYRTVGMLLRGGTPIVPALEMVAGLLHPRLRTRLAAAVERVREGASVSQAMEANGLVTPVATRMLRTGEKGGNLAQMMESVAAFHDEELGRWVDWFMRLFEPLLMAAIGVVIGLIVVLMYLPIFELAGSLQ